MVAPELEQKLLQLSPDDKLYIIQILAQSLTIHNNNIHLLKTLIESLQPATPAEIAEYTRPQFYGCIQSLSMTKCF